MNITYNWSIQGMSTLPTYNNDSNVVTSITYNVTATDSDTAKYSKIFGTINTYALKTGVAFIPFENLTEDVVVGWAKSILGDEQVQKIQDTLAYNLLIQITPPVGVETLPWVTSTGT
jgi:hypothetical protein